MEVPHHLERAHGTVAVATVATAVSTHDRFLDGEPRLCPGCGSPDRQVLFESSDRLFQTTQEPFRVVSCLQCGLIRLHPWPTEAEIPNYYPPGYWFGGEGTSGKLIEAYRRFVLMDHVRFVEGALQYAPEGLMIDVGSGGGLLVSLLQKRDWRAVGFDFAVNAALIAQKHNHVTTICGRLESSPIRAQSCSVVTMFHVLEHLRDPASYLQEAHRILKPGGRLVVQVPNAASWGFLLFGPHWLGVDVPRHLVDFRVEDIRALLDFCGFDLVREKHFSLRDNAPCTASSIAPSLDPMSRRARHADGSTASRLIKDLLYFALVGLSLPFAIMEASCGEGSTVMFDARRRP